MSKTITLKELLKESDKFYVTYATNNGIAKRTVLINPEDVLEFLNKNIYEMKMLAINDVMIDIEKLIEKYSR